MITITAAAIEVIKEKMSQHDMPYLRLGIRGGGCEGFKYVIKFEVFPNANDSVLEQEGIKILIDPKSLTYLNGAILDWQKTLMSQGFKFLNLKEQSRCGCGESISFK